MITATEDIAFDVGTIDGVNSLINIVGVRIIRFSDHGNRGGSSDINAGAAINVTKITAAEDVTDGSNSICNSTLYHLLVIGVSFLGLTRNPNVCAFSFYVITVHVITHGYRYGGIVTTNFLVIGDIC